MVADIIERIQHLTFCKVYLELGKSYGDIEFSSHEGLVFVDYQGYYFQLSETSAVSYNIVPILNKYLNDTTELVSDADGKYVSAFSKLFSEHAHGSNLVAYVKDGLTVNLKRDGNVVYFDIRRSGSDLVFGACYNSKVVLKRSCTDTLSDVITTLTLLRNYSPIVQELKNKFEAHGIAYGSEQFYDQLIMYACMFGATGQTPSLKTFVKFLNEDIGGDLLCT